MKNIHILQTNEPARIFETTTGLQFSIIDKVRVGEYKGFHIYITSDEEIKDVRPYKGKWQLEKGHILNKFPTYLTDLSECKLVILTTDPTLIADGVQAIGDEFVELFVKNPSCEWVDVETYTNKIGVEYDANGYREMDVFGKEYRIKILQEEPKQDLLPDFKLSKDIFDKLSNLSSKELSQEFSKLVDENFDELIDDESKHETLEEAAICYAVEVNTKMGGNKEVYQNCSRLDFIAGAKYMAEKMYSEEDMIEFSEWVSINFPNQHNYLRALQKYNQGLDVPKEHLVGYRSTKELFEKFKKK